MIYLSNTELACSKIEVISEKELFGLEADQIRKYAENKREEGHNIVDAMAIKYQRQGNYLNEIVEKEKEIEKQIQNARGGSPHDWGAI